MAHVAEHGKRGVEGGGAGPGGRRRWSRPTTTTTKRTIATASQVLFGDVCAGAVAHIAGRVGRSVDQIATFVLAAKETTTLLPVVIEASHAVCTGFADALRACFPIFRFLLALLLDTFIMSLFHLL